MEKKRNNALICKALTVSLLMSSFILNSYAEVKDFKLNNDCKIVNEGKDAVLVFDKFSSEKPYTGMGHKTFPLSTEHLMYKLLVSLKVDQINEACKYLKVVLRNGPGIPLAEKDLYGFMFKEANTYQDIVIPFPASGNSQVQVQIMAYGKAENLNTFTIKDAIILPLYETPYLMNIIPNKVRYLKNEKGEAEVTIVNPTQDSVDLTIKGDLISGIDDKKGIFSESFKMSPKETKIQKIPYQLDDKEYGKEIKISLLNGNKLISERSEYFTVADNIWKVMVGGHDGPACHQIITWNMERELEWEAELRNKYLLGTYSYANHHERFSWSPGLALDLTPDTEVWWSGQSTYRGSISTLKNFIKFRQKRGVACITYNNQQGSGPYDFEVVRKHPEWAKLDSYGAWDCRFDVKEFEEWEDLKMNKTGTSGEHSRGFPYIVLDYTNQEVVEHVIQEIIKSTEMFNWDGIRWDCGQMGGIPENIRKMKKQVWAKYPKFLFGYNGGSGNRKYEKEEVMECYSGGGCLMDEAIYTAYMKNHPLHKWAAYQKYLVDRTELAKKYGGYYNPFVQHRGGCSQMSDCIYENTFQLAAGAHPSYIAKNYGFKPLAVNYPQFVTRFAEFIWDDKLELMNNAESVITVNSKSPIIWKNIAKTRQINAGNLQYIVNLINPPYCEEVDGNTADILRESAGNVELYGSIPSGYSIKRVCMLAPETKIEIETLKFSIEDKKTKVLLPPFRFWKIIVFDFEKK